MITCSTDSMYIMSRSETIAPFITMISSPLMMPGEIKMLLKTWSTAMTFVMMI